MFSEWVNVERAVYAVHRPVSLPGGVFCKGLAGPGVQFSGDGGQPV
jgi:hypothetical protein